MIIASPKKKSNISITTCCIEQKSQIKYLGVFIDEHLKWNAQLQHNNKLTNVGTLFKFRHYMPTNALKQLYYPPGLKKTPIRSSGTSRFSLRASNFLSFLARWARAQASHSPTKFLIMIFEKKS